MPEHNSSDSYVSFVHVTIWLMEKKVTFVRLSKKGIYITVIFSFSFVCTSKYISELILEALCSFEILAQSHNTTKHNTQNC
jgi:hypothetical protein